MSDLTITVITLMRPDIVPVYLADDSHCVIILRHVFTYYAIMNARTILGTGRYYAIMNARTILGTGRYYANMNARTILGAGRCCLLVSH